MVELILPPDPQALLPHLLACLPTAFASTRPPPALLPLLSPILQQRIQLLSSGSNNDTWLKLLCWDPDQADKLRDIVENANFEPHPSSGEIEVGEIGTLKYKRFDEETLRAQVPMPDWSLCPILLWCTGSDEGNAWKLAELKPYDEEEDVKDNTWSISISEANESSRARIVDEAFRDAEAAEKKNVQLAVPGTTAEDDDDDYWDQYDKTPGRTPARQQSVSQETKQPTDTDYYSRYSEVQPAMDGHDPDEEMENPQDSSLQGNTIHEMLNHSSERSQPVGVPTLGRLSTEEDEREIEFEQPVPSSPSSSGSHTVARLEEKAEMYAASEIGVRQHIGTTMKSMFRLAKCTGMDRDEFERIIRRELETLAILDNDD